MPKTSVKTAAVLACTTTLALAATTLTSTPASAAPAGSTTLAAVAAATPASTGVRPALPTGTTRTVTVSTTSQLKSAISAATPGTAILLHKGSYVGPFDILRSGTSTNPISVQPYGDGAVTLTASLAMPSCGTTGPDINRTVRFRQAASYWAFQNLNISGGVYIPGAGVQHAYAWMQKSIKNSDWRTLRAVPGRGTNDKVAARNAISYVAAKAGATLKPIDGIQLVGNTITRKGVHITMSRYGVIKDNTITDIACGTGPGIWFGTYSDGWTVTGNTLARVAASTVKHYMQEGIRVDNGSNYNVIDRNRISDLPGDGRAFTTDQTASYNRFTNNTASNVAIGFNDQMAGWGNLWDHNTVTGYRSAGIAFRMMDAPLKTPSMATSTNDSTVTCNSLSGTGAGLQIGAMMKSRVANNKIASTKLGPNVPSYWVAQGNTFNGKAAVPTTGATAIPSGAC
ncbi:NosD domain-containing protein [Arthrobacter sp. NEB 688]|uniref:NosD domain-containing protein n=1 Tax=Arthrobacter sp. NEB 688 TaxID=904039 RepID=UPI0015646FDF|nr:NosD domain-containing protein [Arthrobacter sp. NEB 688]QKE85798.1 hypothetical protein HL663_18975 [Arthrobacter sp. NEB 688]